MHYLNLVIIKQSDTKTIEQLVAETMERGRDDWWDWYQIGGRWSGFLDGYDPEKDPENQVICDLCNGTGTRKDWLATTDKEWIDKCKGCNGCHGTGKHLSWPTEWKQREGDIIPVSALTQEHINDCFRIVEPYGKTFGGEDYIPWAKDLEGKIDYEKIFPKKEKPPLDWLKEEYKDHLVVIVDNHN